MRCRFTRVVCTSSRCGCCHSNTILLSKTKIGGELVLPTEQESTTASTQLCVKVAISEAHQAAGAKARDWPDYGATRAAWTWVQRNPQHRGGKLQGIKKAQRDCLSTWRTRSHLVGEAEAASNSAGAGTRALAPGYNHTIRSQLAQDD
jgi:hypothetical protein